MFAIALIVAWNTSIGQTPPSYVSLSNLVAWYPLNGNSGDSSGHHYDGSSPIGHAPIGVIGHDGVLNHADSFNDISQFFIEFPPFTELSGATEMTISFWVKYPRSSYTLNGPVFSQWDSTQTLITDNPGFKCAAINYPPEINAQFTNYAPTSSVLSIASDYWHHVCIVYNSALPDSQRCKLYLDYYNVDSINVTTPSSIGSITASTVAYIGRYSISSTGNKYFTGCIDNMGIWNRALDTCEIKRLFSESTFTPSGITGASSVCVGSSITLLDATSGGIWSSSSSIATVDTGIIMGIRPGVDTIFYTATCGVSDAWKLVTVNTSPIVSSIICDSLVCAGSSISLLDTTSSGIWTSSILSVAIVGTTGVVPTSTAGVDTISYSVTNTCGTTTVTKTVTINPLPNAGLITGFILDTVGNSITLIDTATSGIWSSGSPSIAIVNSIGILSGVGIGIVTISYSVTNTCGTTTATINITIVNRPSLNTSTVKTNDEFILYPNPTSGVINVTSHSQNTQYTIFNSNGQIVTTEISTNYYSYDTKNLASGTYFMQIKYDNATLLKPFVILK